MALHTKLRYFERFGLINVLTASQRRQFVGLTRMLEVKRGSPIYLPGDPSDQMFLVKAGVIKISSVAPGEGERILTLLCPGDVFGELAIVDDAPRDHRAVVHEDAVICAMSRETLLKMIHAVPELGFEITKLMGQCLQRFQSRVEGLLCRSAPARLVHALGELADRHGVPDADGVRIPLRLSQSDLGRLVGLRRETVNAILQDWRAAGLVEVDRQAIRIRDLAALRRVI